MKQEYQTIQQYQYLENAKNTIEYTDGEIFRAGAKYKQ